MSCVCVLAPVVIVAWPTFSAAVLAAATSLGYQVVSERLSHHSRATAAQDTAGSVEIEIKQSELVMDQIGRDQRLAVTRDGVTVTFSRDARGRASLCVAGQGHSEDELRAVGQELGQRVVQQYVYQRLKDEIQARQFVLIEEEVDAGQSIRLKVRHWEN